MRSAPWKIGDIKFGDGSPTGIGAEYSRPESHRLCSSNPFRPDKLRQSIQGRASTRGGRVLDGTTLGHEQCKDVVTLNAQGQLAVEKAEGISRFLIDELQNAFIDGSHRDRCARPRVHFHP